MALVPSGVDLVADVDLAQLRAWATTARLRAAGLDVEARLAALGVAVPEQLERVVVAVSGAGTDGATVGVIARGGGAATAPVEAEAASAYHGGRWVDRGGGRAWAPLGPEAAVFGTAALVRRAIDVAAGADESVLSGAEDGALRVALARAPTAKKGTAAVRAALRVTPAVRARLVAAGGVAAWAASVEWLSGALAVGDGVDLGLVLGARDPPAAARLLEALTARLRALDADSTVRYLGLAPLGDSVRLARKDHEVHVAVRVGARRLDALVTRGAALARLGASVAGDVDGEAR